MFTPHSKKIIKSHSYPFTNFKTLQWPPTALMPNSLPGPIRPYMGLTPTSPLSYLPPHSFHYCPNLPTFDLAHPSVWNVLSHSWLLISQVSIPGSSLATLRPSLTTPPKTQLNHAPSHHPASFLHSLYHPPKRHIFLNTVCFLVACGSKQAAMFTALNLPVL